MRGRRSPALLFLVAGVLLGVWLFRDARRADMRFPVVGASSCADVLRLEIGPPSDGDMEIERALSLRLDGPELPPWTVALRGPERVLRGELRCRSGQIEVLAPRSVEVRDAGEFVVDLAGRCPCVPGAE